MVVGTKLLRQGFAPAADVPWDTYNGFAGPDTLMGIIKTGNGYEVFATDGDGESIIRSASHLHLFFCG